MTIEPRSVEGAPKRVLLIGWDAADWQMIHPLVEQGLMPTLAGMIRGGSWGNLASIRPMLSPILWNSIATGKRAEHHGVLGFTEPDPDGGSVRPSTSTSRKCKALWNLCTQAGLASNVVGWYASHPAEPIHGVMVSNQFEVVQSNEQGVTPPAAHSVHPHALTEELAALRVLPAEIDAGAILPFVPSAQELVKQEEHRLGRLQQMLAQTATVHAVATHLIANTEWDFSAVYYEGIDRFGHEFMEFHPPKMDQVSAEEFDAYQHCMVGIYRFHDMMLQTLIDLAGDQTAVIVMSDHGYYNNHLRPDPRKGKSGPVDWHRPFGMLAAQGPGIEQGGRLFGASLLDVAPTVLQLLGLPAARDMPGRVLAEALTLPTVLERIESWEEIEGDSGQHPDELRLDPVEAREALRQLVDLGYIEAPSEDSEKSVRDTIAHNQLSLAQSLMDANRFAAALEVLQEVDESLRRSDSVRLLIAACCLALKKYQEARDTLGGIGDAGAAAPRRLMMLGSLEFAQGNPPLALEYLERVSDADPRLPGLHNKLGAVYLAVKQYEKALLAFEEARSIDPESPLALEGIARAKLELGDPQAAYERAMAAAELVHHMPRAHLTIGRSLMALGDYPGAVEALELCVSQAPRFVEAQRALSAAYRALGESQKAIAAELRAKQIQA